MLRLSVCEHEGSTVTANSLRTDESSRFKTVFSWKCSTTQKSMQNAKKMHKSSIEINKQASFVKSTPAQKPQTLIFNSFQITPSRDIIGS